MAKFKLLPCLLLFSVRKLTEGSIYFLQSIQNLNGLFKVNFKDKILFKYAFY